MREPERPVDALPDVSCVIVTSRLRPGLDGGYTVATMQRAALLADAGLPVTLLTVDLHPDYCPFAEQFRRLGLADERTVMRNLLDEVRAHPALLRDAADSTLTPTLEQQGAVQRDAPDFDAQGRPWRQLVCDADGAIVHTDFFDAEGAPLFRLPYLARPDWWRAPVVIDVFGPAGERRGGLAGFGGLYRAWVDAVVAELVAEHPDRPVVAIAEARQVGELLIGTPGMHLVHTVHNAHTMPPHAWNSPIDVTWSGWLDTLPGYDAVVWLTHEQRADVVRRRGAEEAPGWVIPHPARVPDDIAQHPETVAGSAHRDAHRAVMVARLAPQKRIDHAIRAWALVVRAVPDARLDIYGDGALRAELQTLIDEQGLAEHVTLHGHVPAAPEQTRTAACLLVTSVYEGQSLAIAEAMARGCPAVSYDIAYGPAEMIVDGESGLLVPSGDVEALAAAVVGLLRDDERRDRFSRAALAWAASAGPGRALERWRDLLATVTATPPRSP